MTVNEFAKKAYKRYIAAGMTPEGACGLMGNQYSESAGFHANRVEFLCLKRLKENGKTYTDESYTEAIDNGDLSCEEFLHPLPGKQYGYGLCQWTTPARKSGMWNATRGRGKSIADEDGQIDYVLKELAESYGSVLKILKTTRSVKTASDAVLTKFEMPADCGEAVKNTRYKYAREYYDYFKEVDMAVKASQIINVMKSWVGMDRAKGTHKPIIDLYNSYVPHARGYMVTMKDSYCDATVSAAFIKLGAVDMIGGPECGVEEHVQLFKKKGIWNEDGKITPKPGYIIVYNWDDTTQPNDGYADHIGIVEKVDGKTITAIEGNINGKVGRRTVQAGYGCIRGYAIPKYAAEQQEEKKETNKEEKLYIVQAGCYSVESNAKAQVERLKKAGFDAIYYAK